MSEFQLTLLVHLLRGAVATTLLVLLAAGLGKLLRFDSPRTLRWIYAAALLLPMLSPLASFPLRITLFQASEPLHTADAKGRSADFEAFTSPAASTDAASPADDEHATEMHTAATTPPVAGWQWQHLLPHLPAVCLAIWLLGFVAICVRSATAYLRFIRKLDGDSHSADASNRHSDWYCHWRQVLTHNRTNVQIPLVITGSTGPCLVRKPAGYVLAVPAGLWQACTTVQREAILRHELSHFTRGDVWKQAAVHLLAAAQWFNPAAWFAAGQFAQCGEWLSDADAAGTPQSRLDLARALTQLATTALPRRTVLAHNAAGHPLSQRIERLVRSPLKEVSPMKKFMMIVLVAGVAFTQLVRLEVAAEEQAPTTLEGVKTAVEELSSDVEKLKTAVRGLKTRGDKLKQKIETKVEELKTLAANPQQISQDAKKRAELMKSEEKEKQLQALKGAASLGDEGLLLIGHAVKSSPHEEVRQQAISMAASLKEKGLPALAMSLDSVTNKDLIYLVGEIEKHQMADRILIYKALIKDADNDLQDAVLDAGAKLEQRALFIGSLAENADATLIEKMLKSAKTMKGRDGLILLFAAAGAKESSVVLAAVEAAQKRGAEGLPVLAPAAKLKDAKVRYAVVKAAQEIGGEAGEFIVERCLEASEAELRTAATKAVEDAK